MSSMTEITVIIPTFEHDHLARVANEAFVEITNNAPDSDEKRDATFYLTELVSHGNWTKGAYGVDRHSAVSFDSNYGTVKDFIEVMRPFWLKLYAYRYEGHHDLMEYEFSIVTLLSKWEQADRTTITSLMVNDDQTIAIKHQELYLGFS